MEILVNSYGSKVRVKNKVIVIKNDGEEKEFSPYKIEKIIISPNTSISGEVISICKKHSIDLIFLDKYNFPCARIWDNKFGSISTIRKNQLEFFKSNNSFKLVKEWQYNKMETMLKLVKSKKDINKILKYQEELFDIDINLKIENFREKVLYLEAASSKIYFKYVNDLLPIEYKVDKREKKNAKTRYNSILNYFFGILYNLIEREIIISGLDPSIGILHIDNYGKKPFVYDLIEQYRYICYESSIEMLKNEKFIDSDFEITEKGFKLGINVRKNISKYLKKILKMK